MSGQDDRKLPFGDQDDEILTPKNVNVNSIGEDNKTPSRALSSHSLLGENIVLSSRPSSAQPFGSTEFSPSSIDVSETTTPPHISSFPISLSPPPLNIGQPFLEDEPEGEVSQEIQQSSSKQPAIGRRRPPRGPHVALPSHPNHTNQHHHGRVPSSTDYSFMSALTESSSESVTTGGEGRPMRRTISWDSINGPSGGGSPSGNATVPSNNPSTPANILQPILLDDAAAQNLPPPPSPTPPPKSIMATHATKNQPKMMNPAPTTTTRSNTEAASPPGATKPPSGLPTSIDTKPMEDKGELTPEGKERGIVEPPKRYSLMELQVAIGESDVESAVLQSMENVVNTSYSVSSRSLMPSISDDRVHDFEEEEKKAPELPQQTEEGQPKQETDRSKLADLTHQLLQTQKSGARKLIQTKRPSKNAVEKMAETASVIFATNSSMRASTETAASDVETGLENCETLNQEDQEDTDRTTRYTKKARRFWKRTRKSVKNDTEYFLEFLEPKKAGIFLTWTRRMKVFMLPSLGMAAFLYYVIGNPPTGKGDTASNSPATGDSMTNDEDPDGGDNYYVYASSSWWVLFVGVRQVVTLFLAQISELLIIDFLTLRTRFVTRSGGPYISLLIAQSKGWPFQLAMWGLLDVCMLSGNRSFAQHWLYWQGFIDLMNDNNPAGNVTNTSFYLRLLYLSMVIGIFVTVKRSLFGRMVGKRLVGNYSEELARVMKKMILMSEVAYLAKHLHRTSQRVVVPRNLQPWDEMYSSDKGQLGPLNRGVESDTRSVPPDGYLSPSEEIDNEETKNQISKSTQMEIMDILGEWEEPELHGDVYKGDVTMTSILEFRRALAYIDHDYPFSPAFGPARKREQCIASAQMVYEHLHDPSSGTLTFKTLSALAVDEEDGKTDLAKIKSLIKLFRPERNGDISKLDFIKSVDSVYKSLRVLLAGIASSSQIDEAYEQLINGFFYIILFFISLGVLGVDTTGLFVALSGLIVAFAFMIGPASSKYFEGLLLILVRKPYDVGDRIAISDPEEDTNINGSAGWIVEKVDLFTTTVRFATTREVATISNGALAGSRIINLKRSQKALVYIYLKFSVDIPYDKVEVFKVEVTAFVKDRPRQWLALTGFRSTRIEADLGFIEYVIVLQHRESWQSTASILQSKADLSSFCLELQKKLGMKYSAPSLPVNLSLNRSQEVGTAQADAPPHLPVSEDFMGNENLQSIASMLETKKTK